MRVDVSAAYRAYVLGGAAGDVRAVDELLSGAAAAAVRPLELAEHDVLVLEPADVDGAVRPRTVYVENWQCTAWRWLVQRADGRWARVATREHVLPFTTIAVGGLRGRVRRVCVAPLAGRPPSLLRVRVIGQPDGSDDDGGSDDDDRDDDDGEARGNGAGRAAQVGLMRADAGVRAAAAATGADARDASARSATAFAPAPDELARVMRDEAARAASMQARCDAWLRDETRETLAPGDAEQVTTLLLEHADDLVTLEAMSCRALSLWPLRERQQLVRAMTTAERRIDPGSA